jgi:hypothetical protein
VKRRRSNRPRPDERRRDLVEQNLLADHAPKSVLPKRGCVLPFIGIGIALLAAGLALAGELS